MLVSVELALLIVNAAFLGYLSSASSNWFLSKDLALHSACDTPFLRANLILAGNEC